MMKTINWIFIVSGTFIMMFVMMQTGKSLKTPATPLGILDLEFAYNAYNANNVVSAWTATSPNSVNNVNVAIKNTWLDFIFLFFYSIFLFFSCKTIGERFNGVLKTIGGILAMGALNAGLLDIAENTGMLFMLNNITSNGIALFTTICAIIKWFLALAAVFYVVLFGPLYLLKKK